MTKQESIIKRTNPHKNIKVSVIILNWNGIDLLQECLDSLSKQTFKDFETILVDNGSSDGSVEFVEKNFPVVKIIKLNRNEGFCLGNNIGLQYARGDLIALLNNDTLVDIHWLEELHNAMTKHHDIGLCASCIVNYYSRDVLDTAGDGFDLCGVGYKIGEGMPVTKFQDERYVFGACAGAVLYRRSMIDEIGFFDEMFFAVGEDLDLSFRAKLAGYKCLYVPNAIIYHKINYTVGRNSAFLLYQSRRNIEYTFFKNMPLPFMIVTLPLHIIYNILTFSQALYEKRITIFLKAKKDFVKHFKEIHRQRKEIQSKRKISLIKLFFSFSNHYLFYRIFHKISLFFSHNQRNSK
ncbi:MAG: glycosyltransferase family 2 protein [Thermodesulfobacteriota bacterium]|nr:glycosyltransferase family 2 protein [Thermodesulfobacteriota bacterium]